MNEKLISAICLTCGVRDNHTHPNGFCQNGHDDWFEERDFYPGDKIEKAWLDRAKLVTGLGYEALQKRFMDRRVKQFEILGRKKNRAKPKFCKN